MSEPLRPAPPGVKPGTWEHRVWLALDTEHGTTLDDLCAVFGGYKRVIRAALGRLRRKGLARCSPWAETYVWYRLGGAAA